MKKILLIAALFLVLSATPSAWAAAGQCNDIPWGSQLSVVEQVTFSYAAEGIRFYTVNKVDACGISAIENAHVTYGFRDNRLYSTIVEVDKARSPGKIVGMLIDEYGLPDAKSEDGWDVYRWETDTLKIKLKSQYLTDRVKIGMYYKPLDPK